MMNWGTPISGNLQIMQCPISFFAAKLGTRYHKIAVDVMGQPLFETKSAPDFGVPALGSIAKVSL